MSWRSWPSQPSCCCCRCCRPAQTAWQRRLPLSCRCQHHRVQTAWLSPLLHQWAPGRVARPAQRPVHSPPGWGPARAGTPSRRRGGGRVGGVGLARLSMTAPASSVCHGSYAAAVGAAGGAREAAHWSPGGLLVHQSVGCGPDRRYVTAGFATPRLAGRSSSSRPMCHCPAGGRPTAHQPAALRPVPHILAILLLGSTRAAQARAPLVDAPCWPPLATVQPAGA